MDRNHYYGSYFSFAIVALRKESVDRNDLDGVGLAELRNVALRKESVDRNAGQGDPVSIHQSSLSARRAWIEIPSV